MGEDDVLGVFGGSVGGGLLDEVRRSFKGLYVDSYIVDSDFEDIVSGGMFVVVFD